jgi:hypothetical protein
MNMVGLGRLKTSLLATVVPGAGNAEAIGESVKPKAISVDSEKSILI